jgi:tyrosyl-tRNA synthetase
MTLSRTLRALTIMGRSEKEKLDFSQLMYPSMQSADIKALDLDIVHAGMDQRKIHMLVREIFPKLGWKVPVSVHHHLLPGLSEPTKFALDLTDQNESRISSKMSKTNPMSGISIHDDDNTIKNKISRAYCPIGVSENNPILEIIKYVVFHNFSEFKIDRLSKYGGNIVYEDYVNLEHDYDQKNIHPKDLKDSVSIYLNKVIEPIRNHFKDWTLLNEL